MAQKIDWNRMREKAGPYPPQAYDFVRDGLQHTVKTIHPGREGGSDESRHVSGQQLCLGLRDYAVRQYGRLARTVLSNWHINTTRDFGRIVFAMIDAEIMRKTEHDTVEDFADVYDFDEAFGDLSTAR